MNTSEFLNKRLTTNIISNVTYHKQAFVHKKCEFAHQIGEMLLGFDGDAVQSFEMWQEPWLDALAQLPANGSLPSVESSSSSRCGSE